MKNIIIFTNSLLKGGAEKQAALLATLLQSQYNITFIIFHSDKINTELMNTLNEKKINVIALSGNKVFKIWRLFRAINKTSAFIIFNYLLFPNLVGGILGKLSRVKYTIGGIRSSFLEKNKIFLNRIAQNKINNYTIYNNYKGLDFTNIHGFNNKKAIVIPNCIHLNSSPIPMGRPSKSKISILSVGRFDYSKDYYTALQTIKLLNIDFSNITYTIVGWGDLDNKIKEWTKILSLEKIVKIVIDPPDLNRYYKDADIFFQTSIFEGLSNTIMEAMNFGLPVVGTDVGDNKRLIRNGENGFLTDVKNIYELKKHLGYLINNQKIRMKFGVNGYNKLSAYYSLDIYKKRYCDFIEGLSD